MRRLLVSVLVLLLILFTLDRVVGGAMQTLFRTSAAVEDGDFLRRAWNYRAPVVICGSSRAMHHYASDTLGALLGTPAYNLGRDGAWGPVYEYGVAGVMLHHYTPKLWIMDVESMILRGPELTGRLSCFLPYVDDEPVAREVAMLRSRYEPVRLVSRTYRYNSLVLSLLSPRLGKQVRPRQGFLPLHGTYVPVADPAPPASLRAADAPAPEDSLKQRYLRRVVDLLRSRGVAVLAVRSPHYLASPAEIDRDQVEDTDMRRAFARLGVPYLDFSPVHVPSFAAVDLYKDATHLNEGGALLFTHALADSLRARGLLR